MRRSLSAGRRRLDALRLLETLQLRADAHRKRIVRRDPQELLVRADGRLGIACELSGVRDLELKLWIVRPVGGDSLVDRLRGAVRDLRLLVELVQPLARLDRDELRKRIGADLPSEPRLGRGKEERALEERSRLGLCGCRLALETVRLREVEAGELRQRVRVLRPQLRVPLERRDRLLELPVVPERGGEIPVRLRVLRVLLDSLARITRVGAARGRAAADERDLAVEDLADPGRAGADAEDDEAEPENGCEQDEDPLRLTTKPGEEERRLDYARAAGAAWAGDLSMARLALAAAAISSCHWDSPLS